MYNASIFLAVQVNEPVNIYHRNNPSNKKYIPGNSRHTYRLISDTLGKQKVAGTPVFIYGISKPFLNTLHRQQDRFDL